MLSHVAVAVIVYLTYIHVMMKSVSFYYTVTVGNLPCIHTRRYRHSRASGLNVTAGRFVAGDSG